MTLSLSSPPDMPIAFDVDVVEVSENAAPARVAPTLVPVEFELASE